LIGASELVDVQVAAFVVLQVLLQLEGLSAFWVTTLEDSIWQLLLQELLAYDHHNKYYNTVSSTGFFSRRERMEIKN
jgi:hypothetical protein